MNANRRQFLMTAGAASLCRPGAAAPPDSLLSAGGRARIYFYDQYAQNDQVSAFARRDEDRIPADRTHRPDGAVDSPRDQTERGAEELLRALRPKRRMERPLSGPGHDR